jgi:hypothetical protein
MSALKSDFTPLFEEAVKKLQQPWSIILQSLDKTPQELIDIIGQSELDISGVHIYGQQYTLETIATRQTTDVAHFLYTIYGLVLSCTTGKLDELLTRYARHEWVSWLLKANVGGSPAFLIACSRSLKEVATWMVGAMNECSNFEPLQVTTEHGDTALHIAIRKEQWEWAVWLVENDVSPYQKNKQQQSPLMLVAPNYEKIELFKGDSPQEWYNALHDALVYGKNYPKWCETLLELGADVNQPELYDATPESLQIFAMYGMNMNLATLPATLSIEQRRIFYLHGHIPTRWDWVLEAFSDETPLKLYAAQQQITEN